MPGSASWMTPAIREAMSMAEQSVGSPATRREHEKGWKERLRCKREGQQQDREGGMVMG